MLDNFTPLRLIQKKKKGNFFLLANIFLLIIIVGLTGYFFSNTIFPFKPKANPAPGNCPSSWSVKCGFHEGGKDYCKGDEWCIVTRNECKCTGNCYPYKVGQYCLQSETTDCKVSDKCTKSSPTNTPTPTPTPTSEITNTPTPTPTTEITNTPTPTPTTGITNTPTPTATPGPTSTPTPTGTPGPTATPIPVACGTKDCDNATNPCRSGYVCVQAVDGSNYCSSPDFVTACKANPSQVSCCTAPGYTSTPTPTTTYLAQSTTAPTTVTKMLSTGGSNPFVYLTPALIIIAGLLL